MSVEISNLCQSGEKVTTSGIYRLVEATSANDSGTLRTLYRGEYFPNHRSWESLWYLVQPLPERSTAVSMSIIGQEYLSQQG